MSAKEDFSIIMDNFKIELVAESAGALRRGLEIAFAAHNGTAKGWGIRHIDPDKKPSSSYEQVAPNLLGTSDVPHDVLVFYWSKPENDTDYHEFPTKLDAEGATKIAMDWLNEKGVYGEQPDHDGSNDKGFYLFCNTWGHVLGSHYGMVAVGPAWAMAGK